MGKIVKHLVIPDTQVKEGVPLDHLEWCGKYAAEKEPDSIIMIGDFADMESLCSYDKGKKSFEGRRYKKDTEAARRGMELLVTPLVCKAGYKPRLVLCLGNHEDRITRATEATAELDGLLSIEDLHYKDFGWEVHEYLKPVLIDGVAYCHYFPSGVMGRPCTSARAIINKFHQSCFAGHQQGRDIAYSRRADGKTITAIIAGSFYQHEEAYLNPVTNQHWRGVYMLHEVVDGSFDEMAVSLNYLKRRYGNDGKQTKETKKRAKAA